MNETRNSNSDHGQRVVQWTQEHGAAVRGYLFGMLRSSEGVEDLWQETLHKAWEARERYHELGQARAYLLRIADRLALDRLRRRATQETTLSPRAWEALQPAWAERNPAEASLHAEQLNWVRGALAELTEPQRRVLLLRYFGELEFAAIAEQMGCPLGTVLSHCRRGLEQLRKNYLAEE